jgi:thiamine kinase-like enzyme
VEQANEEKRRKEKMNIRIETLTCALSQRFRKDITSADYQTMPLQGGTVGSVYLVTGIAETADGEQFPYRLVLKIQKKWERYGDPGSWRREYDLYKSDLGATFSGTLFWPTCYYAEFNAEENEFQLWLEYIDGVTGLNLTSDMYEQAALELGRYQGKLYTEQPAVLQSLNNLSHPDLMKNTYLHYRSWPLVYNYIRSEECELPHHVRQMLIDIDEHADEILARIEKLPLVLCHRDFWVTNLIYADGNIALIDWDTSGWGYLGEDIASLVADEANIDHMVEYYQRCVPAYYRGFSEYADASSIADHCVREMILLIFGYRLVEWYLHTEDDDEKRRHVLTLQKIYEMKTLPVQG